MPKIPVIFVGHGSPMNAIEDNEYSEPGEVWGQDTKTEAIISISTHWYTRDKIMNEEEPRTI